MNDDLKFWGACTISALFIVATMAACIGHGVRVKSEAMVNCIKAGQSATDCSLAIQRVQ